MDKKDFEKILRGKNINFLIGSGASSGLYNTLNLASGFSIEEIIADEKMDQNSKILVYYYYCKKIIKPMIKINKYSEKSKDKYDEYNTTITKYKNFVNFLIEFLENESNEKPKRINIFTTNYDLLFETTFDLITKENSLVYFNDGSRGFFKKYISNSNFYLNVSYSGYNDVYKRELSTINLIKFHGSVSWKVETYEDNKKIAIDDKFELFNEINKSILEIDKIKLFKKLKNILEKNKYNSVNDLIKKIQDLKNNSSLKEEKLNEFFNKYKQLAIVNPDKRKFWETILEEHYYQNIRSFSYELEKKQTILIVFGFSFADEHIREIFKRSLSNFELQVIFIYFNKNDEEQFRKFEKFSKNIKILNWENKNSDKKITFTQFF
ncbi:hypothetical protein [Mycoplasma sp. 1012]